MTTTYPAKIDTATTLPLAVDNLTPVQAPIFNNQRNAVLAIETALGVQPEGIYGTVAGRFATLENIVGNLQIIRLAKDLGGTLSNPLVIGLQGNPVSNSLPGVGEVLTWDGIAWVPATVSGGGGGSGNIAAPTISIQSNNVSGSTSAGPVTIQGGNALGTGQGGTLHLEGGNGGATNGPSIVINGSQNPTAGNIQVISNATSTGGALVVDGSGNVSSTGVSPIYQTVLDLNFATQPNQTLGTDGNFTIAGLTWIKENSINDASPMAIVNGTGLTITPTNGPDYNFIVNYTGQRTCPLLRIPFSQFPTLSNMTWQSKVRIWVALTPQSLTFGGYYRVFAAMDSGPSLVATNGVVKLSVWAGGGGVDNDTVNSVGVNTIYASSGGFSNEDTGVKFAGAFNDTNQALMLELDRIDGGVAQFGFYGSYAGASLPSYYALNRIDGVTQPVAGLSLTAAPTDVRQMSIALGAVTQNPGPAASIQRLRIDVLV